jgi:hypothetical protein
VHMQKQCFVDGNSFEIASFIHGSWSINIVFGAFFIKDLKVYKFFKTFRFSLLIKNEKSIVYKKISYN